MIEITIKVKVPDTVKGIDIKDVMSKLVAENDFRIIGISRV